MSQPNAEVRDSVIIDAVTRFQQKRTAPSVQQGNLDVAIMRAALHEETSSYLAHIMRIGGTLADLVDSRLVEGMESYLPVTEADDPDSEEVHGVFYRQRMDRLQPLLIVPSSVVENARNWLGPLFDSLEDADEDTHTAAAVAVTAWTGLAGWTFDLIDPTAHPDYRDYSKKYVSLAKLAHLRPEDLENEVSSREKIDDMLTVLKLRFMGAMAYEGLMQEVGGREISKFGISKERLDMYRVTYAAMFDQQVRRDPASLKPLYFAAAHPLSHEETAQTISLLIDN